MKKQPSYIIQVKQPIKKRIAHTATREQCTQQKAVDLLLGYALDQYEAGLVTITAPSIVETEDAK